MGIYNFQYDPRTDPRALFAQGAQNLMGGLMQGRERRRLGEFAEGMDPEATAMQIVADALRRGINPQMAMGLGSFQQGMQPGVGNIPWAATQMTPAQRQNWLDNYGRGVTVQTGQKLLPEADRLARAKAEQDEALGRTGPSLSITETDKVAESVKKSVDNARDREWGPNYTEENLFREWKKYVSTYKFDNDTQRESVWNTFKNEVERRGGRGGHEVDWDPTDPKWREAIGLKAPVEGYQRPKTTEEFEKTISLIKNPKQQELYYNKWKHLWPEDYE